MADALASIKGLLESEKYADLTIRCSGEIFRVHCAILCTRSPFLAKAVDGQFREAALRDIDLPDDEVSVIRAMIRYLYTDDYDDYKSSQEMIAIPVLYNSGSEDSLVIRASSYRGTSPPPALEEESLCLMFNVKMYIAGDKYDISGLRKLAAAKFKSRAANQWNSTAFTEAALHLWENTVESDRQLRDIVISFAHQNIDALLDRGEFTAFIKGNGDFSFDIVRVLCGRSLEVVHADPEAVVCGKGKKRSVKEEKKKKKKVSIWGSEPED